MNATTICTPIVCPEQLPGTVFASLIRQGVFATSSYLKTELIV